MAAETTNTDVPATPARASARERSPRNGTTRRHHAGRGYVPSMPIEIRLKDVLQKYGLDTRGVTQDMAKELQLHRHTIGKIYRNQLTNPSLVVLSDICGWLHKRRPHIPLQQFLAELLVIRPSELWQAIAAVRDVKIWLGNHVQTEPNVPMWAWISQEDAETMKEVVALLSRPTATGQPVTVNIDTVPFRYVHGQPEAVKLLCKEDKETVQSIFKEVLASLAERSHILIGSQRVNYLLECLVAHLFGCRPFTPNDGDTPRVPFHHVYRADDHPVPSCFGDRTLPGRGESEPGLYFLDERREWQGVPWRPDKEDAAMVIVWRDPRAGGTLLAVFGFSGRATMAIGRHVTGGGGEFWHPNALIRGRHIAIYYCHLRFKTAHGIANDPGQLSVVPLSQKLLESCLR